MTVTKKSPNYVRCCNIISAILLLALIICQIVPFWQVDNHEVSIQGYVWLPDTHTEILDYLKAETNPGITANDIVLMPVIVLISGIIGIFLCLSKSSKVWCACFSGVCGIAGSLGYLTAPVFQLGRFWELHLILCFALCVIAVATVICWGKNRKQ